jgi:hypothetical protein
MRAVEAAKKAGAKNLFLRRMERIFNRALMGAEMALSSEDKKGAAALIAQAREGFRERSDRQRRRHQRQGPRDEPRLRRGERAGARSDRLGEGAPRGRAGAGSRGRRAADRRQRRVGDEKTA